MKRSSGNRSAHKGSGNKMLLGIFVGLMIGVVGAFAIVLYLNKADLPFKEEKSGRPEQGQSAAVNGPSALPLPGKPGDKPVEKPRFEFYKILPGTQEPAPGTPPGAAPDEQPAVAVEQFYLQVGAFQKAADADNVKAKLALIGLEARVQDIAVADKGTLHRVRTGPYATPTAMNEARTLMAQNGIQSSPIKIKESGNQTAPAESKQDKP
jgi:cell division protein FtsN